MKKDRPSREEIAAYYPAHTLKETADHFGVKLYKLYEWIQEEGLFRTEVKPSPEKLKRLYETIPIGEIAKMHRVQTRTVRHWLIEAGIVAKNPPRTPVKIPENFRELYPLLSNKQLAKYYNTSEQSVAYWARKLYVHKYDTSYIDLAEYLGEEEYNKLKEGE